MGSPGRRYWAAESRMESRSATSSSLRMNESLPYVTVAVHLVPSRSTPGQAVGPQEGRRADQPAPGRSARPVSARPVGAADAGVHGLPQVVAEDRVGLGDPGQGPADGLADGDPSALALIGERTDTAPEPCRASQLSDQPVSLGAGFLVLPLVPRLP